MLTHDTILLLELLSRREIDTRGCWRWQGGKSGAYGYLHGKGVHVLMYRLAHGAVPAGLCVCHTCDMPDCFNPEHLFTGTKGQNNTDRAQKGRNPDKRGERHHLVKLTEAQVLAIRKTFTGQPGQQAALARQYGVHRSTIGCVLSRKSWPHLP